jgi:tellurite resistance protein
LLKDKSMTLKCRHNGLTRWPFLLLMPTLIAVAVCIAPGSGAVAETKNGSVAQVVNAPGKISREQATQAALQALPGRVTDVTIEKKRGKTVYVIEIVAEKDGAETDVLVDIDSGTVLGMDH